MRNAVYALTALYGVRVAGMTDIQLLENASRIGDKVYLRGLHECVQSDLNLDRPSSNRWLALEKELLSLMNDNHFAKRSLAPEVIQYRVNDVIVLPDLHQIYLGRVRPDWLLRVEDESEERVTQALSPAYDPFADSTKFGLGANRSTTVLRQNSMLEQDNMTGEDILDKDEAQGWDNMKDGCRILTTCFRISGPRIIINIAKTAQVKIWLYAAADIRSAGTT